MTKPARTIKTPKQRAEERLALAQRAYDRASAAKRAAEATSSDARMVYDEALSRLKHRQADPDLYGDPELPIGGES